MPIHYDETKWPYVVVTMPTESVSESEFARHLDYITSYFHRGEPFGLVIDARSAPPLTANRRRLVAERIDEDFARHGDLLVGTGVILSSAVGRGVFKVIVWMKRSNHPMMSFEAVEPALVWLRTLRTSNSRLRVARKSHDTGSG